jgi:death-on-curing protein
MIGKELSGLYGVSSIALLESAINAPFQTFGCNDLYPTLNEKAARLCFGIIKNHPFADGNKRAGLHSMLVFLELNDVLLTYTQDEIIEITVSVATSQKEDGYWLLLDWLNAKS